MPLLANGRPGNGYFVGHPVYHRGDMTVRMSPELVKDTGAGIDAVRAAALRLVVLREHAQAEGEESPLYPHQRPPDGGWDVWMIRAGRGAGKTEAGSRYVREHIKQYHGKRYEYRDRAGNIRTGKHNCRIGVMSPKIGDVRDVPFEGETGLVPVLRRAGMLRTYNRTLLEIETNDGAKIKGIGSEKEDRWNGPQWCLLWSDELALCNPKSVDQALFGLRLYEHPRMIATTTPKRRKWVREMEKEPGTIVSTATTYDNVALDPTVLARLERKYKGRALGRQELLGEYSFKVEGAMWDEDWIDLSRVYERPEVLTRVVVAVDPKAGGEAQTGLTVAARAQYIDDNGVEWKDYFVLHSEGQDGTPAEWGTRALELHDLWEADCIVAEKNNGGDMVEHVLKSVVPAGRVKPRIKLVSASRGKATRAEPVAALHQEGRVHLVGVHEELEEQLCGFPIENTQKDILDSFVWAIYELEGKNFAEHFAEVRTTKPERRPQAAGIRGRAF